MIIKDKNLILFIHFNEYPTINLIKINKSLKIKVFSY